jgi:hypothetical protein
MTEKIVLYSIIGIAVSTALAFLTKATGKSIEIDESRKFNLRMNKLYGFMGIIGLFFGLLFLIFIPLTTESNNGGIYFAVILMLLIFWGTGIPCLLYYRNHRVTFDENTIIATSVYGKIREIKWTDIEDIRFKAMSGLLILTTKDDKLKIHQHLVGLSKFIEFLENKTKWTRKELKVPIEKK